MHPQVSAIARLFLALWLAITPTFVWATSLPLTGVGGPAAVAGYVGPANITGYTSPYACWSLRACTTAIAAAATQNLIDIVDQAGLNPLTVKVLSTGDLDVASINAWVTAHSVTTIQVVKLYDQSGNGRDMVQSGAIAMPSLLLNTLNGKAVLFFNASNNQLLATANVGSTAQPFTFSGVINPIGTGGGRILCNSANLQFAYDAGATNDFLFAGTVQSFTAISGWQSAIAVFNDPSSSTINLSNAGNNPSGTPTTLSGSAGAATLTNTEGFSLASRHSASSDQAGNFDMFEMLVTTTAVSSANQASLVANQRAYGSF